MTDQPETNGSGRSALRFSIWLLLIPVLYALSIGPAAKLDDSLNFTSRSPKLEDAMRSFYTPVILVVQHSTTADTIWTWYVYDVWRVRRLE